MLISHCGKRFIFIHIYKNAGTSIVRALLPFATTKAQRIANRLCRICRLPLPFDPQPLEGHSSASKIISAIGQEAFHSLFSFAVVRNPWDWQVSLYNFMLMDKSHSQHRMVTELGSFDAYIRWRCENEVRLQKDFVCDETDEILVDFVGRFERIDEEFRTICSRIGVAAALPKTRVSNTRPYQEFYTPETVELVRRTFAPDVELFEYDFK